MNKQAIQQFFSKTARILREQEAKIAQQKIELSTLSAKISEQDVRKHAFALAKKAALRGIIDTDVEAVDKYAADIVASGKDLDVVDEALKMASSVPTFEAVNKTGSSGGGKLDPITSALFGMEA